MKFSENKETFEKLLRNVTEAGLNGSLGFCTMLIDYLNRHKKVSIIYLTNNKIEEYLEDAEIIENKLTLFFARKPNGNTHEPAVISLSQSEIKHEGGQKFYVNDRLIGQECTLFFVVD